VDYRILGPLEVRDGDRTVELGGDKPRTLLAVLLLHAGEVISADRLIDDLWGGRPPPGAQKALQAHVSRLRKALDAEGAHVLGSSTDPRANGALLTRGGGYVLNVEPGEVDVDRFREALEQGRRQLAAGDAENAAKTLRTGLELWRGPPLADFTYAEFAQAPMARLEELRLSAIEERVEADLALGRHEQVVGELAELVEQDPLRERLRLEFMLALYRCGREAEALDSYQNFRRRLAEELGLDPTPRLQQLEAAILARDPSLDPPANAAGSAAAATSPRPPHRAGRDRWRRWPALGGLGLIVVALTGVLVSRGGGAVPPSVIAPDSVGAISPARGTIAAVVPVGSSPGDVAAGGGTVWVANYTAGSVSRIDPATHAVVQTITAGPTPSGIAMGAGAVWVANNFSGRVSRIDPTVNKVVQTIPVGNGPTGVAVGFRSVWVSNSLDGTLSRIDPVTGVVRGTVALGGGATQVAAGLGAVWVSDEADGRVLRVDPRTNQVTETINVGTGPNAITVGYGSVWVVNTLDGTVSRINPQTDQVAATVPVGNGPGGIAAGAGGMWVANTFGGTVARLDPATDRVSRRFVVGNRPDGVAIIDGLVWVSAQDSGASHRGGTLTVLQNAQFGSLDPARPGSLGSILTLWDMTNDGLVAFNRVGGSDGALLVPDLAVSLPTPTDGGLTYTFRLRSGVRYSNGQLVRPEDFRRAIERDFTLGPGAPLQSDAYTYFENVAGAAACLGHPGPCDLARGIVTNDATRTVTFHLVRPDPELLAHLAFWAAAAVPASAPDRDVGTRPLPATGPYKVASVTPRQVTLVRNPFFHEWSHAAQPDGYADRIVWRLGASTDAAVTAVERGRADFTLDGPPSNRLREVETRFASQVQINPTDEQIFMGLNTRARPFTDPRVRRALSYAIDRAKLARLLGQHSHPTCQMLPRYVPGHQAYCPYTLDPSNAGVWHAPNVQKAKSLIAASGTRGTPITIWNQPGFFTDFTAAGRYLVSLLDRLGYPTRVKTFSVNDTTFLPRMADSRTSPQAYFYTWSPGYPAASEFLGSQFWSCDSFVPNSTSNNNLSEFCDPRFDATVRRALVAEGVKSPSAGRLWAKADREFTDQAPVVPFVTPSQTDFVSRRVGGYQYSSCVGALIDQLWVH
jgi:YVTN family beta-propeller protein